MFDVNFEDIVTLNIPPHKRGSKLLAFIHTLISPIVALYNQFKQYRVDTLYQINFDGSTIHLERFLNDEFNNGGTGIVINTNETDNALFLSDKEYAEDTFIPDKAFSGDDVYVADPTFFISQNDFTVQIPAVLFAVLDQDRVNSFINIYKLAGKTYNLEAI